MIKNISKTSALLVGLTLLGTSSMVESADARSPRREEQHHLISVEQAKQIALQHARIRAQGVYFSKIELDNDDNRPEYELEFFHNETEYDYEINARTGKVTDFSKKRSHHPSPVHKPQSYISQEKAKRIAYDHLNVNMNNVRRSSVDFEIEDGFAIYDVTVYTKGAKYEFEIDASNGRILEFKRD